MTLKTLASAAAFATLATGAYADDTSTVTAFYDLLSTPGSQEHIAAFEAATSDAWESLGDYSGPINHATPSSGRWAVFSQLIPDLDRDVQAMHQDGRFVTVRSRATGTPTGPLFGVDGEGRGFDIMTIDIHEIENGVILRSDHVEDWAGALQQLAGR